MSTPGWCFVCESWRRAPKVCGPTCLESDEEMPPDLVKSFVAGGAGNTARPLTHPLEQAREG